MKCTTCTSFSFKIGTKFTYFLNTLHVIILSVFVQCVSPNKGFSKNIFDKIFFHYNVNVTKSSHLRIPLFSNRKFIFIYFRNSPVKLDKGLYSEMTIFKYPEVFQFCICIPRIVYLLYTFTYNVDGCSDENNLLV